jgi:hypothetical protein
VRRAGEGWWRSVKVGGCLVLSLGAEAALSQATDPVQIQRITQVFNSGIDESRRAVIRSGAAWSALWAQLEAGREPTTAPPSVDFSRDLVIVAAMGQRNSGGHAIQIREVADDAGRLIVKVVETSPGPGCLVTMALTEPVDVVRLPGMAGRQVEFAESKEIRECS